MYYQPFSTTDLLNWEVQYSLLLGQTPSDGRDDRVSVPDTPTYLGRLSAMTHDPFHDRGEKMCPEES